MIEVNKNDYQDIQNIKNIEVPIYPIEIIDILLKDYEFMKKFIDYKRDAFLALLNIFNTIVIHDKTLNLNFEKKIIDWKEFFEIMNNSAKEYTRAGKDFYKIKENNNININFQLIDENFLEPIMKKIFYNIYKSYLKKFPYWGDSEQQNDYINIDLKEQLDINNIRCYWHFKGVIFIQDTKLKNPFFFKVEFSGKPKFLLVFFDLIKLEYLRRNEKNLKTYIDIIGDKIIAQNLEILDVDFEL